MSHVHSHAQRFTARDRWPWKRPRRKGRSHPRDNRPANRTYCDGVTPPSPDVARARFAEWTKRTLRHARQRGLTDHDIVRLTGIGQSTFHRWQGMTGGLPNAAKVRAFAEGLDVPLRPALRALGLDGAAAPAEPELDPDLRPIARRLADPKVSEAEKTALRNMLRLISRQTISEGEPRRAVG